MVSTSANLEVDALMERPRWWCHALAATFSAVFVAAPLIMLLDRRDPINIEAISLIPNETRAGNPVTMRWRATVNIVGCDGIVVRRFGNISTVAPMSSQCS